MNDDLLLLAESDFLDALQNGPQMLASYRRTLSELPDLLSTAMKTGNVGAETLSLAHSVATRISKIASCFLDIKHREEVSTAQLQGDCDTVIRKMGALDLNAQSEYPLPDHNSGTSHRVVRVDAPTSSVEGSSPFFTSAYQWLLDNLHNPYPTGETKIRIAAASSCRVSSINTWFVNARRRIGWTALCRVHFSSCKADMIDAAHRALVEEDPHRMLSPELRRSFVEMKVAAENLYSSTFSKSTFVGDLNVLLSDVTEEREEFVEGCRPKQTNHRRTVRDSYPSPDRSTRESPVPALDSPSDESKEESVSPPIVAGSKRRRSSIEPVDEPVSVRRPLKRLRRSIIPQTHLPSPPSSTDGIDVLLGDGLLEPHFTQSETIDVPSSCKQYLSNVDIRTPEQPSGSITTSCLHAAATLWPRFNTENEISIDDWFNTNFDALFTIPPPVDSTEPDFSTSLEVELFRDYSIPGSPKCAPQCQPTPNADTCTPTMTDLSNIDTLLQSIGSDTFLTPLESVLPTDSTGISCATSFNLLDMSQPNVEWTLPPNTYQSAIRSTFSQYSTDTQPLPDIDLSMLQLPAALHSVDSQGDFSSKQAKLHQLHAMQEAVRQMEQELQSEGVII